MQGTELLQSVANQGAKATAVKHAYYDGSGIRVRSRMSDDIRSGRRAENVLSGNQGCEQGRMDQGIDCGPQAFVGPLGL